MAKKVLVDMAGLMELIREELTRNHDANTRHWNICRICSDQYELWYDEGRFPTWLSRIVEGEIRDAE